MKALFRTDASFEIGTGHVMRCLTLADSLRQRGYESVFVCREHAGHLGDLIKRRGHSVHLLAQTLPPRPLISSDRPPHLAWLGADWQEDAEQTASLALVGFDLLIVDHYALDINWEKKLRPHCKHILVIDDLADRNHDCDFLLDQNLIADFRLRYEGKVSQSCIQMLGPKYALLQSDYAELRARIPPREGVIRRILIYFGGADAYNLTGMAISACQALQCQIDVVVNSKNSHIDALRKQVQGKVHIVLHEDLPSLAVLIAKADLAIGACGATSWERCCLGLPSLVITLAENQKPIAAELDRRGFITWLGHRDAVTELHLSAAIQCAVQRGLNPEWSALCMSLIDGLGAARVSELLNLKLVGGLTVRPVTWQDKEYLLDTSHHEHVNNWFRTALRDIDDMRIFVVETRDRIFLGYGVFRQVDSYWELATNEDLITPAVGVRPYLLQSLLGYMCVVSGSLLRMRSAWSAKELFWLTPAVMSLPPLTQKLTISICTDRDSWINSYVPDLILWILSEGHEVSWGHSVEELPEGDLCFFLSYSHIVGKDLRSRYTHNLVVHESALPKGRGWAPMSWQILEGASEIPVTLLEATDEVDAGVVYLQDSIALTGFELNAEWRTLQAECSLKLCRRFIESYPEVISESRPQVGEVTTYLRRRAEDSRLDSQKSIGEQFNLLRVVNNEKYPAFFELKGQRFFLRIERTETT